jgi:hypothetical protein
MNVFFLLTGHTTMSYNHVIEHMTLEKLSFYEDGTMTASAGFFYIPPEENNRKGLPWIYCGTTAAYVLSRDSLKILHPGYKRWMSFFVSPESTDEIKLSTNHQTLSLTRSSVAKDSCDSTIGVKELTVKIVDDRFQMLKTMKFDGLDNVIITEFDFARNSSEMRKIKLPGGYFNLACRRLASSNIFCADSVYFDKYSSHGRGLRVAMVGEVRKEVQIIGDRPEPFLWALIPFIYCEDVVNSPEKQFIKSRE